MSKNAFKYQRGEVYYVKEAVVRAGKQDRIRAWVLLGVSPINLARSTVIAIPLSSSVPEKLPLSIKVSVNKCRVCAIIDQIRAIEKRKIVDYAGHLTEDEMDLIGDGLRQALAL